VRVVCKHLECNGVAELARLVLTHVELEELIVGELLAADGIGAVFFEPWDDVNELEDNTGVSAYGILVGL
jgi:hypothetical protein